MVKKSIFPSGEHLTVIVVAAGRGTRFGTSVPKQFLPLKGKPVVVHALEAFSAEFPKAKIILVLSPDGGLEHWHEASKFYSGTQPYIVYGGETRTDSVCNALDAAKKLGIHYESIVMIHDGARPIVDRGMIRNLYNMLALVDRVHAAVPCYAPTEALAQMEMVLLEPVSRDRFRSVQTPQTFDATLLIECYDKLRSAGGGMYDDDAAVFAAFSGQPVYSYEGDRNNIKITRPADIHIAEILMEMPIPYEPLTITERYLCLPPGVSM